MSTTALTPKEQQVIALVAQGLKNREIATVTGTTEFVIKNYLRTIFDKTGMWNRVELALWYVKQEYVWRGRIMTKDMPTLVRTRSSLQQTQHHDQAESALNLPLAGTRILH